MHLLQGRYSLHPRRSRLHLSQALGTWNRFAAGDAVSPTPDSCGPTIVAGDADEPVDRAGEAPAVKLTGFGPSMPKDPTPRRFVPLEDGGGGSVWCGADGTL